MILIKFLCKLRILIPDGPIARATFRTSLALGLRLMAQASTLLLVARMLGPGQFGSYAAITALAVLLGSFSTFGTHLVLLAEVAKNPTSRGPILAYAVPTTFIAGSFLLLLYLGVYAFLFAHSTALPWGVLLCIGGAETLLQPLLLLPASEHLAQEKTARSQLLTILPLGLRTLAALGVLLVAPAQPLHVFAPLYLLSALLGLVLVKVHQPQAWLSPSQWRLPRRADLAHSAGYATLAMTATGPAELDKMLAAKLLTGGLGGIYAAASRVIGAAVLPVIALLLSALPRLFRTADAPSGQNKHLSRWLFISVFAYGLSLTGLLWFCAPLVQWMFGPQYEGMADMLRWLCWVVPPLSLRFVASSILTTTGNPWMRAGLEVVGMATLAVLAVTLTAFWGVYGMPLALVCAEWMMAALGGWLLVAGVPKNDA